MIDVTLIAKVWPDLLHGIIKTIQISVTGSCIGLAFGIPFGVISFHGRSILATLVAVYTTIIRGTPMLIQIFMMAYVMPWHVVGLDPSLFWRATIAIGMNSSAYVSNIIRSGIASVDRGQWEAAAVLGLSPLQLIRYIVLPQALQRTLPAIGNELVTLVKDSSLASVIGVAELFKQNEIILATTYDSITTYGLIALIYLIMTTSLSMVLMYLERRFEKYAIS